MLRHGVSVCLRSWNTLIINFFLPLNQRLSTVGLDYLLWVVTWCADGFILVAMVGVMLWCVDRQTFYRHYRWLIVAVLREPRRAGHQVWCGTPSATQ